MNNTSAKVFVPEVSSLLQPWLVVFSAALFFFFEFMQMNMFNAIDPYLIKAFSVTATELGNLSATYFYANVLFLFPAGLLLDRYSTRRLLIIAFSVCIVSTYIFSMSTHLWMAEASRFVTGLGSTFCMLSCVRLASRWFQLNRVALVVGLVVTMAMAGGMIAQVPLTLLSEALGWRHAIMVNATTGFLFLIIIIVFVVDYPKNYAAKHSKEQLQLNQLGFWRSIFLALRNGQNWLAGIYTNLLSLPIILFGAVWGSLYLMQVRHLSHRDSTYVTSMVFLGTIFGSPILGWISDRMASRKTPMIVGALLSLLVVLLIMYLPNLNFIDLMVLFFILGFIASAQVVVYPLVVESNSMTITGTAEGVTCTIIMSAGAIFQPLYGWLMDWNWDGVMHGAVRVYSSHAYNLAMLIFPITFIVALIVSFFIKETYCRHIQDPNNKYL